MPRAERAAAIQQLQDQLGYPLVCYVTSTRQNLTWQMTADAVRYVYEHLKAIAPAPEKIGIVVHSFGGEPATSWRLMSLIREFAKEVVVIVPYHAFSAATLLALGADKILMHSMASLGPTDPSIVGPFNPKDAQGNPLPVSVEDVLSYIALVKDDVRINHEDELVVAFSDLVKQVHPLALGNVKRSHSQAKLLAKKLMQLRSDKYDDHKIGEVVDSLTSKLYYHGHPINRAEARDLDLPIAQDPEAAVERLIWDVYLGYERDMKLTDEFNLVTELASVPPVGPPGTPTGVVTSDVRVPLVMVESIARCDVYQASLKLVGTKDNTGSVQGARVLTDQKAWVQDLAVPPQPAAP